MGKTAINIDRVLADTAAKLLGTPTLTATVDRALREVVARASAEDFVDFLGSIDWSAVQLLENAESRAAESGRWE